MKKKNIIISIICFIIILIIILWVTKIIPRIMAKVTADNYVKQIKSTKAENNEINWDEITTEGVDEQKLIENINKADLEKIATLLQNLSHEIGEKQKEPDFYFTGQWHSYILESKQFNEVLNMGNDALKPLYLIVYKSPNQYLYEYICCMAIQKITDYEVEDWNTSKDFLEKFNKYICDNREI